MVKKKLIILFLLLLKAFDVFLQTGIHLSKHHHLPHALDDLPETTITRLRSRLSSVLLEGSLSFNSSLSAVVIRADGNEELPKVD
jgi:hypothetical protein